MATQINLNYKKQRFQSLKVDLSAYLAANSPSENGLTSLAPLQATLSKQPSMLHFQDVDGGSLG